MPGCTDPCCVLWSLSPKASNKNSAEQLKQRIKLTFFEEFI